MMRLTCAAIALVGLLVCSATLRADGSQGVLRIGVTVTASCAVTPSSTAVQVQCSHRGQAPLVTSVDGSAPAIVELTANGRSTVAASVPVPPGSSGSGQRRVTIQF